jgi:CRISPR/Cas system CSM-associated protein Csm3 (group 7 of RAMP superfamily)
LHTGADTKLGTISPFRKIKFNLISPVHIQTKFEEAEKDLKRDAFALLYLKLWDAIPDKSRLTIYDVFTNKSLNSTYHSFKESWLTRFCELFKINSVVEDLRSNEISVIDLFDLFSNQEFFWAILNENQFIIYRLRQLKDAQKKYYEKNKFSSEKSIEENKSIKDLSPVSLLEKNLLNVFERSFFDSAIIKTYDFVPFISGNSIRGKLRRLVMQDFCKAIGINEDRFNIEQDDEKKTHISFSPEWYHRLFTGGALNESNAFENIEEREKIIELCPMLGLFGTAIGKQTIEGCLNVSIPTLICKETGLSDTTFNDLLTIDFGTRLDSEKTNNTIDLESSTNYKSGATQMKYEIECLIAGSAFDAGFTLNSNDKLMKIVFQHAINLFVEEGNICAKKSIGYGAVRFEGLETNENVSKQYYKYLAANRDAIIDFFRR